MDATEVINLYQPITLTASYSSPVLRFEYLNILNNVIDKILPILRNNNIAPIYFIVKSYTENEEDPPAIIKRYHLSIHILIFVPRHEYNPNLLDLLNIQPANNLTRRKTVIYTLDKQNQIETDEQLDTYIRSITKNLSSNSLHGVNYLLYSFTKPLSRNFILKYLSERGVIYQYLKQTNITPIPREEFIQEIKQFKARNTNNTQDIT